MASVAGTKEFVSEVVDEMKKVTWPDRPQLKNFTFVIIVFVLVVSVVIWLMDFSVRGILNAILSLFTAA